MPNAVSAIIWCVLRRNKFCFGHAVQTIQGSLLDIDVLADHIGGDAGIAQPQCQGVWQRQRAQRALVLAEFFGHPSSMHTFS